MVARLILKRSVVDSILTYAQMAYPKERILLFRGHATPPETVIREVVIPLYTVHGFGFEFSLAHAPHRPIDPWDGSFQSLGHPPSLRAGFKSQLWSHHDHNGLPLLLS
jgi:hypothetical protein